MPLSGLSPRQIEASLEIIHDFRQLQSVAPLIAQLHPAG
jgi:hypothetical protein